MKRISHIEFWLASSISLITFAVYFPALQNDFISWDDITYVTSNYHIHSLDTTFFKWAFFDFYAGNWHPLAWISHALDYAIWGLDPRGHRLTSLVLHAVNTFIVVFLTIRLAEVVKETKKRYIPSEVLNEQTILITAGITGLLFGLHPLHVESVVWVSERKDLLCALFFLLSIDQYIRYARNGGSNATLPKSFFNKHYLLALAFFILAVLSKPMAVTLPVVLLVLDWYPLDRIRSLKVFPPLLIEKLPFIMVSIASSIVTVFAQLFSSLSLVTNTVPWTSRLLLAARSYVYYLWKMVWPQNLVPFYQYPNSKDIYFLSPEYFFAIVLLALITVACIGMVKKQRVWLAVWSFYIVTLIPVIGIIQVGRQSMADRYAYLPSLGPFLIVGFVSAIGYYKISRFNRRKLPLKIVCAVTAIGLLLSVSYLTKQQIGIWKNNFIFWSYIVSKETVRTTTAHNNLGLAYEKKGLLDKAIDQYQIVLSMDPNLPEAHYSLGSAYEKKGLFDQAIEQNLIAIKLDPNTSIPHSNLGSVYEKKGMLDQAIEQYQIAIRLEPNYAVSYGNLGSVYEKKGVLDQAVEQYQIAVRLLPGYARAHNDLGKAYEKKGMLDQAIGQFQIVVQLDAYYAVAHNTLGAAYQKKGLLDQAIEQYRIAVQLEPDYALAHDNLGVACQKRGLLDQAIEQYQIVIRLVPGYVRAHNNLGEAYGEKGLQEQAIEQFRIAVKLDPKNPIWRRNLADANRKKRHGR